MTGEPSVAHVFETLRAHGVRSLLMGGHACIAYGASEFTRDVDLVVLPDEANFVSLRAALDDLGAAPIALPPCERQHLLAGHALHFRCGRPPVEGLRIDVMSSMRGVAPFEELWQRRTMLGNGIAVLGLSDLVRAKKTQRDKDWPMVRRLIEADYVRSLRQDQPMMPTAERVRTWLEECRTPAILRRLVADYPEEAARSSRPAVQAARRAAEDEDLQTLLRSEEDQERRADRLYWEPLRQELERLRLARRGTRG